MHAETAFWCRLILQSSLVRCLTTSFSQFARFYRKLTSYWTRFVRTRIFERVHSSSWCFTAPSLRGSQVGYSSQLYSFFVIRSLSLHTCCTQALYSIYAIVRV